MKLSVEVRITGPLAKYWPQVWQNLVDRGYTHLTAVNIVYRMARLSAWMSAKGIAVETLREEHLSDFFKSGCRINGKPLNRRLIEPFICSLENLGVIALPDPAPLPVGKLEQCLDSFLAYLRCERGFVEHTIKEYRRILKRFLCGRFGSGDPKVELISADDLSTFIVNESRHYEKGPSLNQSDRKHPRQTPSKNCFG